MNTSCRDYIRNAFIDGMDEVFTTLFNDGENDGVYFYPIDLDQTQVSVYGESKYGKVYSKPSLLVCKAEINPTQGQQSVESVKNLAVFTVPIKSLMDRNLGVTHDDLERMRRGIMYFHDTCYYIDNISPTAYVEDTFLFYKFECTEILDNIENFFEAYDDTDEAILTDSGIPDAIIIRG